MRYQTKILIAYMSIVVIVISVIASIFYLYNSNQFKKAVRTSMQDTGSRIVQQIEYQITYMDSTLENLMSDSSFMAAIQIKGGPTPVSQRDKELFFASDRTITSTLYRYPLNKYIYRVNYFNHSFNFYSSRFNNRDTVNIGSVEIFAKMDWLSKVDEMQPKRYISVMHDDQWLKQGENMVFSLIRCIRFFGVDVGYLEIQMESSKLQEMLGITPDELMQIILFTPDGEVLFHNLREGREPESYVGYPQGLSESAMLIDGDHVSEFVVSMVCPYSKIEIVLIEKQETLMAPQAAVGRLAFFISFCVLAIAFFYVYLWSVHLTKPIRILRNEMKRIELSDLTKNEMRIGIHEGRDAGRDDIKALNSAFYNLFNRLSVSIQNELEARELQMQANFDFLQTQINPHFIYNVLNVISNRGLVAGDEQICEICSCIAQMLRYSTSTRSKTATVADEISHVKNYLALLQMRYEHRLKYSVDIEDRLMPIEIPKIVLQPFVENSINHGYKKGNRDMAVNITGKKTASGWFLEVCDNGDGFDAQALEDVHDKLRSVDALLEDGAGDLRLSLGGIGIVGTYARLKMFLPDVHIIIKNADVAGAYVRIEV